MPKKPSERASEREQIILESKLAEAENRPQIKTNDEMEAQALPVKCLAFSGGGAKGAIYSGVYEALEASGTMKSVEIIAGSSAGAITAALIATGITPEAFKELTKTTPLPELLGERSYVQGLLGKGVVDGIPLYELAQKTILANISRFLNSTDIKTACEKRVGEIKAEISKIEHRIQYTQDKDEIATLKNIVEDLRNDLAIIKKIINGQETELNDLKDRCLVGGKIYFGDLALLRIIDPLQFKDLVVTATTKETGKLKIFNTKDTPNVEIALAVRASCGIPGVFQTVQIDEVEYVDGGYRDNVPTKYFTQSKIDDVTKHPEQKSGRMLAFAFGGGDKKSDANIAIYSMRDFADKNLIMRFIINVLYKAFVGVGGKFKHTEDEIKVHDDLGKRALEAIALDTKGVGTLSFSAAQQTSEYLHIKGEVQTTRHLHNHDQVHADPSFVIREFLLVIYEKAGLQNYAKTKDFLSFCTKDMWKDHSKSKILEEYVALAATNPSTGKLSAKTNTMHKLIDSLNDSTTPDKVKKAFIKVLDIDKPKDLVKYKFTEKDFEKLMDRNKAITKDHNVIPDKTVAIRSR